MVDIETTGLYPEYHGIIQIGALEFDLERQTTGKSFCKCLSLPQDKKWMADTYRWWNLTNPSKLAEIEAKAEDYKEVLYDFRKFVFSLDKTVKFWSHHPFDWEMLENYFRTYFINSPFDYSSFRDLDSYIEALVGEDIKKYKPIAEPKQEHDALYDCKLQVAWLFNSINKNKRILDNL